MPAWFGGELRGKGPLYLYGYLAAQLTQSAPRGALIYPPCSGEGLEVISLGSMAYLDSKDEGDNSMPFEPSLVPRRTGRGDGEPA